MKAYTRRARDILANMRIIWKEPLLLIAILAIFYFLVLFVVFPLFQVFRYSLVIDNKFDLSNYLAVFSARYYFQPFLNSIILGAITATTGTLMGFVFAYALTRTPLPFKGFFRQTADQPRRTSSCFSSR